MSGVSLRTIQRIEKGEAAANETAMSIASAFDVDVSALTQDIEGQVQLAVDKEEAKKALQFKLSFTIHLLTYLLVMGILVAINLADSPDDLWITWPAIGWGIGVLAHGVTVFIVNAVTKTNQQISELN